MRVRKKPVEVEAFQWQPRPRPGADPEWFTNALAGDAGDVGSAFVGGDDRGPALYLYTREGVMRAEPGDWIIRGVSSEIYPCKPDIFEQTYEIIGE